MSITLKDAVEMYRPVAGQIPWQGNAMMKLLEVCENLLAAIPPNHDTSGKCAYVNSETIPDAPAIAIHLKVYPIAPPRPDAKFRAGDAVSYADQTYEVKDAQWSNENNEWAYRLNGHCCSILEHALSPWQPKQLSAATARIAELQAAKQRLEAIISNASDVCGSASTDFGEDYRECPEDCYALGRMDQANEIGAILHDPAVEIMNVITAEHVASLEWWVKEIAEQQAVIDKLPKNSENVPVVEGDTLWYWRDGTLVSGLYSRLGEYTQCEGFDGDECLLDYDSGDFICHIDIEKSYSTLAAAEAAEVKK